jgi:hypothetical protein
MYAITAGIRPEASGGAGDAAAAAAEVAAAAALAGGAVVVAAVLDAGVDWGALCDTAVTAVARLMGSIPLLSLVGTAIEGAVTVARRVSTARGECVDILRRLAECAASLDYVVQAGALIAKDATAGAPPGAAAADHAVRRLEAKLAATNAGLRKLTATIEALAKLVEEFESGTVLVAVQQATRLVQFRKRRERLLVALVDDQVALLFRLQADTARQVGEAARESQKRIAEGGLAADALADEAKKSKARSEEEVRRACGGN